MSTKNNVNSNRIGDSSDRRHEHGKLTVRRGLFMFPALLALILMGALLLAWPMGRAAAAPDSPSFETFSTNAVDASSITIVKPADTVDDDLLIAAIVHGVSHPPLTT